MNHIAPLLAAMLLLPLCAAAVPAMAPAPPAPTLSVELAPAGQSLEAGYEPRQTSISGRITLGNAPYAKYEVFLDACDNPGWSASCTPDYVTFWGAGSAEFKINVTVPAKASDQTCSVWVESRATCEDMEVVRNVSASVYLTVGKLPANPTNATGGGQYSGGVSGGSGSSGVLLAAVAIFLVVGLALGFVFWRWIRQKKAGNGGQ